MSEFDNWSDAADAIVSCWENEIEDHLACRDPQIVYESWDAVRDQITSDIVNWNGDLVPYESNEAELESIESRIIGEVQILFLNWLCHATKLTGTDYTDYVRSFWNGDAPAADSVERWIQRTAAYDPSGAEKLRELSDAWS